MNVWLDDIRPAPDGWVYVFTVEAAQAVLLTADVEYMSLDHDLGICDTCRAGRTDEQIFIDSGFQSQPNCFHFGTGYDLVKWMAEHDQWPKNKPTVHSANTVGRLRMQGTIERYFHAE